MKGLATCAAAVVILPLLQGSVLAEDRSKEELKRIFARQLDAIKAAETNPALGRTRGLVLNMIDPSAEADAGRAAAAEVVPTAPSKPAAVAVAPSAAKPPKAVPSTVAESEPAPLVLEKPAVAAAPAAAKPAPTVAAAPVVQPPKAAPAAVATTEPAPLVLQKPAVAEAPASKTAPVVAAAPKVPPIAPAPIVAATPKAEPAPAAPAPAVAEAPIEPAATVAETPTLVLPPAAAPAETATSVAAVPASEPSLDKPEAAPAPQLVSAKPAPLAAATPQQYWNLPKEDQVNVRVTFAFDSAAIAADQKPKLREFCAIMNEMNIKLFRIVGHTDAAGTATYNQKLSVLRAEEVKRFFTDDCGIAPERLEAVGVGEQFLVNPKKPRDGENRRVEFQALS